MNRVEEITKVTLLLICMLLQGVGFVSLALVDMKTAICLFFILFGYGIQQRITLTHH